MIYELMETLTLAKRYRCRIYNGYKLVKKHCKKFINKLYCKQQKKELLASTSNPYLL